MDSKQIILFIYTPKNACGPVSIWRMILQVAVLAVLEKMLYNITISFFSAVHP